MSADQKPKENSFLKIVAIIGGIATILAFVFDLFPNLKPKAAPDIDVEISEIGIERDISYEMYLPRHNLAIPADYTCQEIKANGMVIKPTIKLTGLKGRVLQARSSMYKADRGLVPSDWYLGLERLQKPVLAEYTPTDHKEIWVFEEWIPYPRAEGEFYLRLELFVEEDNSFRSLGYKDTEPFQVTLFPECAGPIPNAPFPPDALTPPS
jgi:hypothetical protein